MAQHTRSNPREMAALRRRLLREVTVSWRHISPGEREVYVFDNLSAPSRDTSGVLRVLVEQVVVQRQVAIVF